MTTTTKRQGGVRVPAAKPLTLTAEEIKLRLETVHHELITAQDKAAAETASLTKQLHDKGFTLLGQPATEKPDHYLDWKIGNNIQCVDEGSRMYLTKGDVYRLRGLTDDGEVYIQDDDGDLDWYPHTHFKPVA